MIAFVWVIFWLTGLANWEDIRGPDWQALDHLKDEAKARKRSRKWTKQRRKEQAKHLKRCHEYTEQRRKDQAKRLQTQRAYTAERRRDRGPGA